MKSVLLIIISVIASPVFSSEKIFGEFTTVSEAACNSEIHFFENGKGSFIDYCRREDGTYIGDIYKDDITWRTTNNKLIAKINGINEAFTYHNKLSCVYFGEAGDANGFIGFDLYFWRKPIKCK